MSPASASAENAPRRTRSDGRATRRRILDAATEEFAQYGIAGARVDRIAANAGANKARIYAYYGSKEALFDAVLADNVTSIVDAATLDPADLPGYAVSLYDAYLANPLWLRLATWTRLERRPTGPLFSDGPALDEPKLALIAAEQQQGTINSDYTPAEVHDMVIALSLTWAPVSVTTAATPNDPESVHSRRRHVLRTAVAHAFRARQ
ncbi:TetR family transcriptional regulator [Streptomyces sp. RP5T]|uniref:TetR family transcriptional regulator n=1 Tax=Streptomyces sp. RP5T TaxID=2490848 RepID=UPI000F64BD24|nr:TetR family transcriptional regulator [Streptomyces sp. RP5T]RRR75738.1 TetR/AcrR family transcriptional regulator [Streptomyces sp. RP5T]